PLTTVRRFPVQLHSGQTAVRLIIAAIHYHLKPIRLEYKQSPLLSYNPEPHRTAVLQYALKDYADRLLHLYPLLHIALKKIAESGWIPVLLARYCMMELPGFLF